MSFNLTSKDIFISRNDPKDPRLGDLLSPNKNYPLSPGFAVAGYPDDEGIKLNGGRPGAAQAPDQIRYHLFKLTPPALKKTPHLYDIGNLPLSVPLAERHELAKTKSYEAYQYQHKWIGLGGGHDYGYPDAAAFCQFFNQTKGTKPLVINIDAHLDVRPLDKGLSSGTPFYRLLSEFDDIDFIELGIQQHCNSKEHFNWLNDKNALVIDLENCLYANKNLNEFLTEKMKSYFSEKRPTFLSIDIDAFSSSYTMGCSQAWPVGFTPHEFLPFYQTLRTQLDIKGLGIYEVSPPLDHDHQTAKWAALLAYYYIFG